jgi:murein DD-endopeptidase MepM/ murein hydrolase activator NlpD
VSFPPSHARPRRLSGPPVALALVALLLVSSGTWLSGQPAAGATADSASPQWVWPVGPDHVVVRPFIAPLTPFASGHRGIDVAAATGAPVLAPADGVVHFAGEVVDRPVLSIRHPGGIISSYEPVESKLVVGEAVSGGERVGAVVAGHCDQPCLHLGVRLHGRYVSPVYYLGGIPFSVLLPTRALR